jgi:hypothetical protein
MFELVPVERIELPTFGLQIFGRGMHSHAQTLPNVLISGAIPCHGNSASLPNIYALLQGC